MMKKFTRTILIILMPAFLMASVSAKKIKTAFNIPKNSKEVKKENSPEGTLYYITMPEGEEALSVLQDSTNLKLKNVTFAGFDKEPNSSSESFHLVNPTDEVLTGFRVKIDYLDMNGRMLHSREITEPCYVPPGETHRFDIKSWDTQKTYYYYLGNKPRKVATPFMVEFHPVAFWIEQR